MTEIIAPDGIEVDRSTLDMEWIEDQCRDALSAYWQHLPTLPEAE